MKIIPIFFLLLIFSMTLIPAHAEMIQLITKNGNVINVEIPKTSETANSGNGIAMIDGMGVQSRIIQVEKEGRITHGTGVLGKDDSIKPYLAVSSTTNFAATVLDEDTKNTYYIPAFWKSYEFTGTGLTDNTPSIPNILGYTSEKIMSGAPSLSIATDGILASGTGIIILKLQDTTPNSIIRGTLSNADVKIVTSPLDLTTTSMSGNNYVLNQDTNPSKVQTSYSESWHRHVQRGGSSWNHLHVSQTWDMISNMNVVVAEESDLTGTYSTSQTCYGIVLNNQCHGIGPGYRSHGKCYYSECYRSHAHSFSASGNSVLTTSTVSDGIRITKQTTSGNMPDYTSKTHTITSTHPWNEQHHFTDNFEQALTIPTNSYLVITLTSGSALIKAESGNNNPEFINIEGLAANTPYQITNDGNVIVTGMTSETGSIQVNSINNLSGMVGGLLKLFPDSLSYRGSFSTVVFDNLNGETIHMDTTEDKIYVVHAYAKIPVIGDVTITDLNLDSTLNIDYLNGDYTSGESINVPVIPGYKTINMEINGVTTSQNYADILGGTGIKIADPTSSTITKQDPDNDISSVEASAGTSTFVVATSDNTINAIFSETISGTAAITNTYILEQSPPPPSPPVRRDPLSGWVDIYVNGQFVHSQTLGINPYPDFTQSSGATGNTVTKSVTYSYPDYTLSGSTSVSVSTGDFVEFYLYGKITGDIETYAPPAGMQINSESGTSSATINIRDAYIQTSS